MRLVNVLRVFWDRIGAWVLIGVGALALILGYRGVSGHGLLIEQMPYLISGGIGGVFLLGIGGMLWLSADLRDEWQKLDRIEQRLVVAGGHEAGTAADPPMPVEAPSLAADRYGDTQSIPRIPDYVQGDVTPQPDDLV